MMLKARCNRHSGWGKGLLDQTKARKCRSKIKVIFFVFFVCKGIFFQEFLSSCQLANKDMYQEHVALLRNAVRRKSPELKGKPDFDVAPRQCVSSRVAPHRSYPAKHKTSVVPHPPYSPDLTQAEIFLFPKLKTTLKGRRFQPIQEI